MAEPMYYLDYLFCCQFTTNNNIIDLLEDLATKKRKCIFISAYCYNKHIPTSKIIYHF